MNGQPDLEKLRYEELVELLEDLTRKMASPEVGIEEAVTLYEQAGEVHAAAWRRLTEVTERLERLNSQQDPAGSEKEPFGKASDPTE